MSTLRDDLESIKRVADKVVSRTSLDQSLEFGPVNDVDMVDHPPHYTAHPSGVECIEVVEHMNFCLGNAMKYLWRAGQKGDAIEDLRKACWYIEREISRRERMSGR